jgi:hypothetical protein
MDGVLRMNGRWWRQLPRVAVVMVVLLALLFVGDWLVLRVRVARGTAYGTVSVNQFLATSLKGNETEYDFMGTVQETCSRTIFPQNGNPPCWWLKWHTSQWR